jgi:hypothetical protein
MGFTYGLEGSDIGLAIVRWDVIDGNTFVTLQTKVDHLLNSLERAVAGLEVEVGSPVIGEILAEAASRAGRLDGRVVGNGSHGGVKGVSSNDLVDVCYLFLSREDEGIHALDDELGTLKTHHLLGDGILREERNGHESLPLHLAGPYCREFGDSEPGND